MKIRILASVLLWAGLTCCQASAVPAGEPDSVNYECVGVVAQEAGQSTHWRSSSGTRIETISAGNNLTVIVTPIRGMSSKYGGRWIKKGEVLEYTAGGAVIRGTIVDDKVNLVINGKDYVWSRVQDGASPDGTRIAGLWTASNGDVFKLIPNKDGIHVRVEQIMPGGREVGTTGRWTNNDSFAYEYAGESLTTVTYLKDGRLEVSTDGQSNSYWVKK